jgi:hypothetical protein
MMMLMRRCFLVVAILPFFQQLLHLCLLLLLQDKCCVPIASVDTRYYWGWRGRAVENPCCAGISTTTTTVMVGTLTSVEGNAERRWGRRNDRSEPVTTTLGGLLVVIRATVVSDLV